jgi:hypothetical protein
VPHVVGLHHVQLAMPPALLVDDLAGLRARLVEAGLPAADAEAMTRWRARRGTTIFWVAGARTS